MSDDSGLSIESPEASSGNLAAHILGSKVGAFQLQLRYLDERDEEHVDVFTVEVARLRADLTTRLQRS